MRDAIENGKQNTAMMSFKSILNTQDIEDVAYFVRLAFMTKKMKNTQYHTPENGWQNHEKYKIAFPFALGDIPLDTSDEDLTVEQRKGKMLYLNACVSCHDRAKVNKKGVIWESRPLSWPRNNYSNKAEKKRDAVSSASMYGLHDIESVYIPSSELEKKGMLIFQNNCAFCHAPDGSGKHWIGQFIEPHPKNFTETSIRNNYNKQELKAIVENGKQNTAMPAWRYVLTQKEILQVVSYLWERFK